MSCDETLDEVKEYNRPISYFEILDILFHHTEDDECMQYYQELVQQRTEYIEEQSKQGCCPCNYFNRRDDFQEYLISHQLPGAKKGLRWEIYYIWRRSRSTGGKYDLKSMTYAEHYLQTPRDQIEKEITSGTSTLRAFRFRTEDRPIYLFMKHDLVRFKRRPKEAQARVKRKHKVIQARAQPSIEPKEVYTTYDLIKMIPCTRGRYEIVGSVMTLHLRDRDRGANRSGKYSRSQIIDWLNYFSTIPREGGTFPRDLSLISVPDAAKISGTPQSEIYMAIWTHKLWAVKCGRLYVLKYDAELIASLRNALMQ